MSRKVVILGANGFIGTALTAAILKTRDWDIYGMDLSDHKLGDLTSSPRFHFVEGDITINKEWVEYHVKKCDAVVPLVAPVVSRTLAIIVRGTPEMPVSNSVPVLPICRDWADDVEEHHGADSLRSRRLGSPTSASCSQRSSRRRTRVSRTRPFSICSLAGVGAPSRLMRSPRCGSAPRDRGGTSRRPRGPWPSTWVLRLTPAPASV